MTPTIRAAESPPRTKSSGSVYRTGFDTGMNSILRKCQTAKTMTQLVVRVAVISVNGIAASPPATTRNTATAKSALPKGTNRVSQEDAL